MWRCGRYAAQLVRACGLRLAISSAPPRRHPALPQHPTHRPQRQRLADFWRSTLQDDLLRSLHRKMELYDGCLDRLRAVHTSSNLEASPCEMLPQTLVLCCRRAADAAADCRRGSCSAGTPTLLCAIPARLQVLRGAKVVGATTSGVAMHQGLISSLGVKVWSSA